MKKDIRSAYIRAFMYQNSGKALDDIARLLDVECHRDDDGGGG